MTASATAPPAPHNRRSRVPNTHRVSLDCHTDGEYAQKQKKITKHFFGRLVTRLLEFEEEPQRDIVSPIYRKSFEDALNCEIDRNPWSRVCLRFVSE